MDSSVSKHDVVEGELLIMKSAFGEDFEDHSIKDEDSISMVKLKLGPHHTLGGTLHSHVNVVLKIATTTNYPDEPASVKLNSSSGLTSGECKQLIHELNALCLKFSKMSMVSMLEVSNHTQSFLSEHARPYSESIYAEMVAGWEAKEKAIQRAAAQSMKEKEEEEQKRRIRMVEEVARIQEALREEARERKEKLRCSTETREGLSDFHFYDNRTWGYRTTSECSADSLLNELPGSNTLVFTSLGKEEISVCFQEPLGERPDQKCSVDLALEKGGPEKFVVYSWLAKSKGHQNNGRDFIFEDLLTKLNGLERDMNSLLKISHKNLVLFRGMKISSQSEMVAVHVVQDYVQGVAMKYYLELKIPVSEPMIQHVIMGVVNGLDYLHLNNIVHRNIRDSCIFLDHHSRCVKLSDYGIERKCVETVMEFGGKDLTSPYPPSPGRGGKKGDVFRLGIVVLSLLIGSRISQISPTIPSSVSKDLRNFLSHCLEVNEHERWTVHQLKDLHIVCTSSEDCSDSAELRRKSLNDESTEVNGNLLKGNGDNDINHPLPFKPFPNLKGYSRFNAEYELMEWLGKGGFGHVYKVRNLIDDRVYALKKIPLHNQSESTKRKMTREVKLLSSLNHENVVRYYTSWIETFTQEEIENSEISIIKGPKDQDNSYDSEGDEDAGFIESESEDEGQDWLMQSLRLGLSDEVEESEDILFMNSSDEGQDCSSTDPKLSVARRSANSNPKRFEYLFIQMQYCEKNTIRHTIDNGLCFEEDKVWRLFREMTNGLDYIHSQGLIHRDLKPGNIFLDSSDHIKIGDFGLATVAFKGISTVNDNTLEVPEIEADSKSNLTSQVGTTLYIAPELAKVVGKFSYSNKVDIYSLGIIFFEMCYHFSTGMERVKILSSLRLPQPQFPDNFDANHSKKHQLILWLLNHDPLERPSTGELLKSPLLPPPTAEEQKFMATLEERIRKTRSKDYQDILNLLFKPILTRPELEATFELCLHKAIPKQLLLYEFVKSQILSIFRSHGGIWIPTSFYTPKGSFYQEKENAVSLMSKGGELITAQFELRYPFAKFVARSDIKYVRRYAIDRAQRAHRIFGIHPTEIYECAFDIIASKCESPESFARVVLVAQEIVSRISQFPISHIQLIIGHSNILNAILGYCGVEESYYSKVASLLHDFRKNSSELEYFGECLRSIGINRSALESLKGFLQLEGSVEDVCSAVQSRIFSSNSKRKQYTAYIKHAIEEIKEINSTLYLFGIKLEILFKPLLVIDSNLYSGACFQLMLLPKSGSKKLVTNILAQGGSYTHIISQIRNQNLISNKKMDPNITAVGVSLPLDRIAAGLDSSKNFASAVLEARSKVIQGHGEEILFTEVFICAIEKRQLEFRIDLCNRFKAENIRADHAFLLTMAEAENLCEELWFVSHFVFLVPNEKVICRSNDTLGVDRGSRVTDRKIERSELSNILSKWIKSGKPADPLSVSGHYPRKDYFKTGSSKTEDFDPHIEYVTRKQTRIKEATKLDTLISDEVSTYLSSRSLSVTVGDSIEVLALDLDRKALLALGQLDVESTVRNFNDSVQDVKARFPDLRDYLDRICKLLLKKIFYGKKSDRPSIILGYSIPNECLKRIF